MQYYWTMLRMVEMIGTVVNSRIIMMRMMLEKNYHSTTEPSLLLVPYLWIIKIIVFHYSFENRIPLMIIPLLRYYLVILYEKGDDSCILKDYYTVFRPGSSG